MKSYDNSSILAEKSEKVSTGNRREKEDRLTFQEIRDHVSGPVLSLILHIIIITFLSAVIVIKGPEDNGKEIIVPIRELDPVEIKEIPEPPKIEPDEEEFIMDETAYVHETADPEVSPVNPENVSHPAPAPDIPLLKFNNSSLIIPIPVPKSMSFRDPAKRDDAVKKHSTDGEKGQKALMKGLRWLKDHQNPDGSWGESNKENFSAYTGLALLAFLGHGETPSSPEFGSTVLRGIKKLIEYTGNNATGVKGGYRHGIVMYALSEAYAITQIPMLGDIVEKGTERIIQGQNSKGSFNYGYDNSKLRCDLSVAGWNYQALKAAFAVGCHSQGLIPAIDKSVDLGLKKTHFVDSGGFSYGDSGSARGSMTSVGVLCLQLFGDIKSLQTKQGITYLEQPDQFWFEWKGRNRKVPQWALYQWYYQTQVFFQAYEGKGNKWRKWDKMFSRELITRQKGDGRWESPAYEYGAGDQHGEAALKGLDQPVYATSLCCLMLEVYYRYMATSAARNIDKIAAKNQIKDNDDLGLKLR